MGSPPELRDLPALVRLFTDPDVRRYLGGPLSQADAQRRAEGLVGDRESGACAIRDDGELIGLVWLSPHHGGPDVELSFVLLPEWQGKGHAFRVASAALRHAFEVLNLPKVVSETQAANARSIALLERLGMAVERKLRRFGEEQLVYTIERS